MSARGEIRALTGIRGLGAALVMVFHLGVMDAARGWGVFGPFFERTYLWVDMFFILSGFILCHVHAGDFGRARRPGSFVGTTVDFLHRRAARVFPLNLVATLLAFSIYWSWSKDWPALLANLAFLQSWAVAAPALDPASWSLSTEVFAYLLFPLLVLAAARKAGAAALGAVSVGALCWLTVTAFPMLPPRHGPLDLNGTGSVGPLVRCVAAFTLGMAAWRAGRATWVARVTSRAWSGNLSFAAMLAGLAVPVPDVLVVALVIPWLILSLANGRSAASALLGAEPLHSLGTWSFSIYMIHEPVGLLGPLHAARIALAHVRGLAGSVLTWAPSWAAVLAAAPLFHHGVERAGQRLVQHGQLRSAARMGVARRTA